ncbi:MAG: single-strand DNA-binding protein [Paraglaciecola sp.]|jgi:single-strand DNA-binding protein
MSYEAVGKLLKKYDTENKTQTFQAREFVIEMAGQYPQMIKFQLTQDRCAALDPFNEGDPIKVQFDLRGREWNGKYFTNLNAWRLEKGDAESAPQAPPAQSFDNTFPSVNDEPSAPAATTTNNDDLPF